MKRVLFKDILVFTIASLMALPANGYNWNQPARPIDPRNVRRAEPQTGAQIQSAPSTPSSSTQTGQSSSTQQSSSSVLSSYCANLSGSESGGGGDQQYDTSQAGVKSNWRYDAAAWNNLYANLLTQANAQNGGKTIKYYRGSSYSVNSHGTRKGRDIYRPDHGTVTGRSAGSTTTVTYAPALHTFENHSLGNYRFLSRNDGSHMLYQDVPGQCNGQGCVVLALSGHSNTTADAHLQTSFRANSDLIKKVRFEYSLYGGAYYQPAAFSIKILDGNNVVSSRTIGTDYQCPVNQAQGYYFCPRSSYTLNLGELINNRNYTLDFEWITSNNPAIHELSLDNIQFLDVANREAGGTQQQQSSGTDTTYTDVYTEFTRINNANKGDITAAFFKNPNTWGLILPFSGNNLRLDIASSLPQDANPTHIIFPLPNGNLTVATTSTASGNKKNYTGTANIPTADSVNFFGLNVASQHQYTSQNPNAFQDAYVGALDRRAPTVSARVVTPFQGMTTTEAGSLVYFTASDDIGLNAIGLSKRNTSGATTAIMENALDTATVGGSSVRAIAALGQGYTEEPIRVEPLGADISHLQVYARDWVTQSNGQFRYTLSPLLPIKIYDLTNKRVTCDKYTAAVGEGIKCYLPTNVPTTKVWVRKSDERGAYAYNEHVTSNCTGANKPNNCYFNSANNTFTADKPGIYDLESLFYDSVGGNLMRRPGTIARIVVQGESVKPVAARISATTDVIFPPNRWSCPGLDIKQFKFYRVTQGEENLIATLNADDAIKNGLIIDNLTQYVKQQGYIVRPVLQNNEEGRKSDVVQTDLLEKQASVILDHSPIPGNPSNVEIRWTNLDGSSFPDNYALPKTKLLPDKIEGPLAFQRAPAPNTTPSPFYTTTLSFNNSLSQNGMRARLTLANTTLKDPTTGEMTELQDYEGVDTDHTFWILGGDFAKENVLGQTSDLERKVALQRMLALVQTYPNIKRNLKGCQFEGNQFVCTPQNQMTSAWAVKIPTLNQNIMRALFGLYFDNTNPQQLGGLLASSEWKVWADSNLQTLYPDASQNFPNFVDFSPLNPEPVLQLARGLGTRDAVEMAWRDRLYASSPSHPEARCLFQTGCSYHLDWLPYYDEIFISRYFQPFLNNLAESQGTLQATDAAAITDGWSHITSVFFEKTTEKLVNVQRTNPSLWNVVDSSSFHLVDRVGTPSSNWGGNPGWQNVYKPFLNELLNIELLNDFLARQNLTIAAAKSLIFITLTGLSSLNSMLLCAVDYTMFNPDLCAQNLENSDNFAANLDNVLSQPLNPYDAVREAYVYAFFASGLFDALMFGAGSARAIVREGVTLGPTLQLALQQGKTYIMQPIRSVLADGSEAFMTLAKSERGAVKVVGYKSTTSDAGLSEKAKTEKLSKILKAALEDDDLALELNVKQKVQVPTDGSQTPTEAAQCTPIGKAAYKEGFNDPTAAPTNDPDVWNVAYRKQPEVDFPHPTNIEDWPEAIVDDAGLEYAGVYPRVEPGRYFVRTDKSLETRQQAIDWANKVIREGIAPGKESRRGVPLLNHVHEQPLTCKIGGRRQIGNGPRPEGGWVSTSTDILVARRFAEKRTRPYIIEVQGRVGNRTIGYFVDHPLFQEEEIAFPNRVPPSDVRVVNIMGRETDGSLRTILSVPNPNFVP